MRRGLRKLGGLTDGAVLSVVAGTSAVALIFVLIVAYTHSPMLTGKITAWIHCGNKTEKSCQDLEKCLHKSARKNIYETVAWEETEKEIKC